MSASLVGSEMCIRDSTCRACVITCRRACLRARLSACLRPCLRACASAAVSYTHLTLPTICSV
eukprot:303441-Alexandrium_andersonii.AAC.1